MLRDVRKNKVFSRRLLILGGIKSFLSAALISRLAYLQLWKHREYSRQSDTNRIRPVIIPAPRGIIFDRNGAPLCKNVNNYRLLLYLESKPDVLNIINSISETLGLSDNEKSVLLSRVKNARRKSVISIVDDLSWYDLTRVESNFHKLPGISIESGITRRYTFFKETAHLIGYASLPSEKEIDQISEADQGLFMSPDFRIGKTGVERSFDEHLRGKYGVKYVEVNAYGTPVRTLSEKPYIEGSRLHLTIDIRLQKLATDLIKNESASVVMMDVKTGEILTCASSPTFDSNLFVDGVPRSYWAELMNDPEKPLNNRPISATYPPGSTFKLMSAIAGLESGVNPEKTVRCNGGYQLGKRRFHCWKEEGHGVVNMKDAILQSCNTYFFSIANSVGIDKMAEVAARFGYGQKFDVSLFGVKSGILPTQEWKRNVIKQPWTPGDNLNSIIGQGFTLATPLQMAVAVSRLANGGVPIKPHLIRNKSAYTQYNTLSKNRIASKEHLDFVMAGMHDVVNSPRGTTFFRRITEKGYEMSGKTGTSQVVSKREKDLIKTKSLVRENQNHAIFVGYAPSNAPKYGISVLVEHGKSGSTAAAPIANQMLLAAQTMNNINNILKKD